MLLRNRLRMQSIIADPLRYTPEERKFLHDVARPEVEADDVSQAYWLREIDRVDMVSPQRPDETDPIVVVVEDPAEAVDALELVDVVEELEETPAPVAPRETPASELLDVSKLLL